MANQDLAAFLKNAQAKWVEQSAAAVADAGVVFKPWEDGKYIGQMTSASLGKAKNSDKVQITWKWLILEGDRAGETKYDFDPLTDKEGNLNEDKLYYLGRKFVSLDEDPNFDISELPQILDDIAAKQKKVQFSLKTKNDWQNMYINRVLPEDYEPNTDYVVDNDDPYTEPVDNDTVPYEAPPVEYEETEPQPEPTQESAEGTVTLSVGMRVEFERNGKTLEGEVTLIDESDSTANVKVGSRSYEVDIEKLSLVSDEG